MHALPVSSPTRTHRPRPWALPILFALSGVSLHGAVRAEPGPEEIVRRADAIRFPVQGFQADVRITTTATGRDPDVREYRILSKGNDNTLVMTMAPAAERGHILLMKGRDLWGFVPRVSQPVRLPLAQRLTGQVANGDLARARFAGDYVPELLRTEQTDGKPHYVLELRPSGKGVTYPRVLYWVEHNTFRPRKADFYSLSGRHLKTCDYEEYRPIGGETRPTRLVMTDRLRGGERSVLDFDGIQPRDLPDVVFTKDYLKKLQ